MGTGGYPDGAESNCGQCENGIYKFYERILKLFRFFRNFRFENAIVYHEAKGIQPVTCTLYQVSQLGVRIRASYQCQVDRIAALSPSLIPGVAIALFIKTKKSGS